MPKDPIGILFDAFWGPDGWRSGEVSAEDRQLAEAAGVMFPPRRITHDEGVEWAIRSRDSVTKKAVVTAFVASLSRRRLDLRSALGSYATLRHLPAHAGPKRGSCRICGLYAKPREAESLDTLNFERLKWGGVRHLDPVYAAFDLELFQRLEVPERSAEDEKLLAQLLETVATLPSGSRARDLEKALKFLPSNKEEREVIVNILGYLGVLHASLQEGFCRRYVPVSDRPEPSASKNDWEYPASWWRGGINQEALDEWFGPEP